MTNPSWIQHPGVYIKEEMEARGWLQRDLAFILGVQDQVVNMLISGKRGISPEMAKALGDAFDVPGEFFANLQLAYAMASARTPEPSIAMRRRMQSKYPVREMIRRGWMEDADAAMLEMQLVRFFGVARPAEIPYLEHAAKKSRYEQREIPPAHLAWLFRVRQIAKAMGAPKYSEKKLRKAVVEFESMLREPDQARNVPRILSECGVRFVISERLPTFREDGRMDGACFWLDDDSPVIGMTTQRDTIDNFWFVLRHECEHVLNADGRVEEILDVDLMGEASNTDSLPKAEQIANAAAAELCAPQQKLETFMLRKHPFYYERDVITFAKISRRHPGLVVGQMQFKLKRYDYLARHLVKIRQFVVPGAIADGWGQVVPVSL